MKIARVIPVFKSGDPLLISNYRPISVLPCFSKILEKIIFTRMLEFFNKNNAIFDGQFGFLPGKSVSQALVYLSHSLTDAFEKGHYVNGTFLDLSKAFDTLDHEILLNKLDNYGIRGVPHTWLRNYLCNRYLSVTIITIQCVRKYCVEFPKVPFLVLFCF